MFLKKYFIYERQQFEVAKDKLNKGKIFQAELFNSYMLTIQLLSLFSTRQGKTLLPKDQVS